MIDLAALILACAPSVHPDTMRPLVAQESGRHPYAIAHKGGSVYPKTREAATAEAKRLLAAGVRFDAGVAQISSANFRWLGLDAETVFDPCANLRASEAVILDGFRRALARGESGQTALDTALSYYNTGSPERGKKNGYVDKVRSRVVVPAIEPRDPKAPASPPPADGKPKEPREPFGVNGGDGFEADDGAAFDVRGDDK